MACAQELADAEAFAEDTGLAVRWEYAIDCSQSAPRDVLSAVVEVDNEILARLSGIAVDPSDDYCRVVAAELFRVTRNRLLDRIDQVETMEAVWGAGFAQNFEEDR